MLIIIDCIPGISTKLMNYAIKSECFDEIKILQAGPIDGTLRSYTLAFINISYPIFLSKHKDFFDIDRVFITYTEMYSRILAYKLLKNKPKVKLFFFEDGIESYSDVLSFNTKNKTNILLEFRYGFALIERCCGLYVYRPEYVTDNPYNVQLITIPSIVTNSIKKRLYNIFVSDLDQNINFDNKIIFFDACFYKTQDIVATQKIFEFMRKICDDRLIIKPHPSRIDKWNDSGLPLLITKNNFEILCLYTSIDNAIFVSAFSTACILPKFIYNKEPKVLLLYELYNKYKHSDQSWKKVFQNVRANYRRPEEFVIPNDFNSFADILQKWVKAE